MEAFGIFEGGGAKGLAHVGALKSAEERHVRFKGVAGASAGAIVAALVAAGYGADELYNPDAETRGVLDRDFVTFFETKAWDQWIHLIQDIERTFARQGPVSTWLKAPLFYAKHRSALRRLGTKRGLFDTSSFEKWMNELLSAKIPKLGTPPAPVTFEDLVEIPLKIIASDITSGTIKIFSRDATPNQSVAGAVSASISIPYFFAPVIMNGNELVDGGLLSNFPAWLFDDERRRVGPQVPTFGFRLVERQQRKTDSTSLLDFSRRLFGTALSGDQQLEVREVENLNTVPLPVSVSTFDFDLTTNNKDVLYREGLEGARNFFIREIGPKDPVEMRRVLDLVRGAMKTALGKQDVHMRVNVVMPIEKNRVRVMYNCGMDDDPDDRLDFEIGSGATGRCWQTHAEVICDLEDAKGTFASHWRMNKYQQAMVRRELRSLLSVPIFDKEQYDDQKPVSENPIIGVLNFDSDEDILIDFASAKVQQSAREAAQAVADFLKT
jgi:NTE family protein